MFFNQWMIDRGNYFSFEVLVEKFHGFVPSSLPRLFIPEIEDMPGSG